MLSLQTRLLAGYFLLVAVAMVTTTRMAVFVYVVTALTCGVLALRHARRLVRQGQNALSGVYYGISLACPFFSLAYLVEFERGQGPAEPFYMVAYVPLLVGTLTGVLGNRQRLQLEVLLESALVGLTSSVLLSQAWAPLQRSDSLIFVPFVGIFAFVISLSYVGRSGNNRMGLPWFVSAVVAVLMEVASSFQDEFRLAHLVAVYLPSAPFVPLIWAFLRVSPHAHGRLGIVANRRQFGSVQLVASVAMLSLPVLTLMDVGAGVDGPAQYQFLLWSTLGAIAISGMRIYLMLRSRDQDYELQLALGALGELLVASRSGEVTTPIVLESIANLGGRPTASVVIGRSDRTIAAAVTPAINGKPDGKARMLWGEVPDDADSLALGDHVPAVYNHLVFARLEVESHSYLVVGLTHRPGRMVERAIRSAASQLDLALETALWRERMHEERAHHRFRALSQDSNDIVMLVKNGSSIVTVVGSTVSRLLGRDDDEVLGESPLRFVDAVDAARIRAAIASSADGQIVVEPFDVRLIHADGHYHWFTASVRDLRSDPEVGGLVYSFRDVNDRKMAELQVRTSEGRYRALIQHSNDVFALIDAEERISYVSPNVSRLLGFSPGDLIGTHARGLLTARGVATMESAMLVWGNELREEELLLELRTASDEIRVAKVGFAAMQLEDGDSILITVHDVTEQRLLEESLRNQALYDPLTGVLNRSSIVPELQRALQSLGRDEMIGVIHLDMVNFSEINSSVGFEAGDNLLVEVANRVRSVIRSTDRLARLDADEFVIVSTFSKHGDAINNMVSTVLAVFDEPYEIGGRQVDLKATFGAAHTHDRRENPTILLENASLACRYGRAHERAFTLFDESMRTAAAERFELAADLRANIETDQFTLVYQPVFDLKANQVTSVEALLRWNHPTRGHVSPGMFIPLAESTGSIIELGRMVMRRSSVQLHEWHNSLPGGDHLAMAINVSARQLEQAGEVGILHRIIAEAGVPPSKLTIELTESTFIEDAALLRQQLESFRALGVRIAVDDFGTGAAGISHLRDVPFDILKIDKVYVDEIEHSNEAANLVSGVVELAHGLGAVVVAEGIETPGQMTLLRDLGCDFGQGFFLARPMTPDALEHWIDQGWAGTAAAVIMTKIRETAQ